MLAKGNDSQLRIYDEEYSEEDFRKGKPESTGPIPNTYRVSGLYRNDGSKEPLWVVDWYAFKVHVASDGIHVIRMGNWPSDPISEAFTILRNGEVVRTYKISDIVSDRSKLEATVTSYRWNKGCRLDDARSTFVVNAIDGRTLQIGLWDRHLDSYLDWVVVLGGLLAVGLVFLAIRRTWAANQKSATK